MTRTALVEENVLTDTQFASLPITAEQLCAAALDQARKQMTLPYRAYDLPLLMTRPDFVEFFKFRLAVGLAKAIGAVDEHVQAVHYFDPNLNPDAQTETAVPLDPTLNLLVVVASNSAALRSYLLALDGYLTQAVKDLPSPLFATLHSLTNVMLVTADDIAQRRGYSLLLDSIYTPTRRLWVR